MKEIIYQWSENNLLFLKSIVGRKIRYILADKTKFHGITVTSSCSVCLDTEITLLIEDKDNRFSFFSVFCNDLGDSLLGYNGYYLSIEEGGFQNLTYDSLRKLDRFSEKNYHECQQISVGLGFIHKIEVYGVNSVYDRDEYGMLNANVNLMIAFYTTDDDIIVCSGGREQTIYLEFYNSYDFFKFSQWKNFKTNQWNDSLFNLKYVFKP